MTQLQNYSKLARKRNGFTSAIDYYPQKYAIPTLLFYSHFMLNSTTIILANLTINAGHSTIRTLYIIDHNNDRYIACTPINQ